MRVLIIDTNSVRPGERVKAEALSRLGHGVTLLAPDSFVENYRRLRLSEDCPLNYRLVTGRMVGKPPNRTWFVSGLAKAFHPRPDALLVLSDENFWLTWQVLKAARLYSPRALFLCHSWQNLDFDCRTFPQPSRLLYYFDTWLERSVFNRVDAIMARNREAVGVLARRGFSGRCEYIPWAVDTGFFSPGHKRRGGVFTIGFVGRFIAEKGVMDLVGACELLDKPHKLLLVGTGPLEPKLKEIASRSGGRVEMIPVTPNEKMPELYAAMDVLALPSRTGMYWKEQFGRVLAEAMACGVSVAASDSGAMPDVVGGAGLVFPEGDAKAMAETLARLAEPELRHRLGQEGIKRARERFSWQAWARSTGELIEDLARIRARRGGLN